MKIILSPDAVFPVTEAKYSWQKQLAQTGLPRAGTLQGEGLYSGVPSLFIRLSGCNLRCSWVMDDGTVDICDTPYASHNVVDRLEVEVSEILDVVSKSIGEMTHVVVTGGEPTLQPDPLAELCLGLKKLGLHITIETNGTRFNPVFAKYVDMFSISPKLSSSNPVKGKGLVFDLHAENRMAYESITSYIKYCDGFPEKDYQIKFVTASPKDVDEIHEEFMSKVKVAKSKVFLMPLGSTAEVLKLSRLFTADAAIKNGWRYSPRIQVDLFGNKAGT